MTSDKAVGRPMHLLDTTSQRNMTLPHANLPQP